MGEQWMCAHCLRCVDSDSVAVIAGRRAVCGSCVSAQQLAEASAALCRLAAALEDSGLGADADVENMPDDEYQMREALAGMIYRQDGSA